MSRVNFPKAMMAGVVGTVVMTLLSAYLAPMMGMPRMNPADMLAAQMGGRAALGWAGHFMIGVVLAVGYAGVSRALPGPAWMRGATFAIAPWLMAQAVMMPMMGMGFFSGSAVMAVGSLVGHLMYGAVVGALYGGPSHVRAAAHA